MLAPRLRRFAELSFGRQHAIPLFNETTMHLAHTTEHNNMNDAWICATCGCQYTQNRPLECKICEDQRQYVGSKGQQWTTLSELRSNPKGYGNTLSQFEPNLWSIHTDPKLAIGQHAFIIQSTTGNIMWDCITYLDEATKAAVDEKGGLKAIAVSHPHYYSTMVEWAHAFDVPIYIHKDDSDWVTRPDGKIIFWSGESQDLFDGVSLLRLGGHFSGASVLHWPAGSDGRGSLLVGDIVSVTADNQWLTFMYSYPNYIPLPATAVRRIGNALAPYEFDKIHGNARAYYVKLCCVI